MSGSTSLTIGIAIAAPALAIFVGCLLATFRAPGLELRSVIRHFTAGVMYAAAGAEVLPDLLHRTGTASAVRVIAGVAAGVAAMIAIRAFSEWLKKQFSAREARSHGGPTQTAAPRPARDNAVHTDDGGGDDMDIAGATVQPSGKGRGDRQEVEPPVSLIAVTAVDVLLDGLTLGVVFSLGGQQGIVVAVALAIEVFFLGISIGGDLTQAGADRWRAVALCGIPAAAFTVAAVVGVTILAGLSAGVLEVLVAAGLVALLYLATEELLKEAHEAPETTLTTAIFFVGFLVIITFDLLTRGSTNAG